jgi:L-fuculose-phosphate aldolase
MGGNLASQVPFFSRWAIIRREGGVRLAEQLYSELRMAVADSAKAMASQGLAGGTSGNVSAKTSDGHIAITPTGVAYDKMTEEDVCVVDSEGGLVVGNLRPSSELPMHTGVYETRPDIGAIVHTHSLYATAFAVAARPISAVHYVIATMGDEIPVVPYELYGSEALAQAVAPIAANHMGMLLQNHGVLALGRDVQQALYHAQTIEYLAQLQLLAEQVGTLQVLGAAALEDVRERFKGYGQR